MISVIIPVHNASKTLEACLESIFNLDHDNFEVIVVDDDSKDNSGEIAKKFDVRLVKLNMNSGPAACRNKAAKIAKGSILAFTDADCEVPKDWLKKAEKILNKNKDIAAVTGPYSKPIGTRFIQKFQHYDTLYFQRNTPKFTRSCTTSNLVCKKNPFLKVGGFPNIRINEDMEFASKLSKEFKICWLKDNGVAHNYRPTFGSYFRQQKSWARGVIQSYLSKPKMFFEQGNFSKKNISLQIILLTIFLISFLFALINKSFLAVNFSLYSLMAIAAININFLNYLRRRINFIFAFFALFLIFYRNMAWLLGLITGISLYLPKTIRKSIRMYNLK